MPTHLKKGGTFISLVVVVVVLTSVLGAIWFGLNKFDLLPKFNSTGESGAFQKDRILRSVDFKDSNGEKRKLVVVNVGDNIIPVADVYLSDDDISEKSLIKVSTLSNDASVGYAAKVLPAGQQGLFITPSEGSGKKYIYVSLSVEQATTITIIDENGQLVSRDIIANASKLLSQGCKCNYAFDSWDNDTFYLRITDENGNAQKVLIDAKTGSTINGLKKA